MKRNRKNYFGLAVVFFFILLGLFTFFFAKNYLYQQDSPYDVLVSDITSSSAVLTWRTEKDIPTYVLLNDSILIGLGTKEKIHRVEIEGLDTKKEYTFVITDSKREWNQTIIQNSFALESYILDEFKFRTGEEKNEIFLPQESYLTVLPKELVYVVLYDMENDEYSNIRSGYANRYGGVVFDKESFNVENSERFVLKNINYFSHSALTKALISKVFASEINCNQDIPDMTSNTISRDAYTDLATRWVAGRGKNYAYECYNDAIYRAKVAGVDPAFTLTIWLNESGASNYTFNPELEGKIEDFGIHGLSSVPTQDFSAQINHFLTLSHKVSCEGLTAWEAWGNYYKWGSCNEDDPIKREEGIEYYKQIEMVYGWVTNGLNLPSVVTGLPKIDPIDDDDEDLINPICCALKLDNRESLKGDFENDTSGESCSDLWPVGKEVYKGKIEYSVEIPNITERTTCEIDYEGVCCKLSNEVRWYPKILCTDILEEITDSQSCNNYQGDKACFLRDGEYQWLASVIGDDNVKDVFSETACLAMNETYSIDLELKKGFNFIGLDLSPTHMGNDMMASDLLSEYPEILLIANFEENSWKSIIVRADTVPFAGDDFILMQAKGYLITSNKDTTISLGGWQNPDIGYLTVASGWNLVGGELYTKSDKASRLISDLKNQDININSVAIWSYESGTFIHRIEYEEEVFGDDFELNKYIGIFLKQNK